MVLPPFVRKFIVDFIETAIGAILLLTLYFPTNFDQATQEAIVVGVAVIGALVSAVRRALPDFITWLKSTIGVSK